MKKKILGPWHCECSEVWNVYTKISVPVSKARKGAYSMLQQYERPPLLMDFQVEHQRLRNPPKRPKAL